LQLDRAFALLWTVARQLGPGTSPFPLHKLGFGVPGPGVASKMGLKTPRGPETPLLSVITLNLGSRAPGLSKIELRTPRDPGTPLLILKTLNLGSRAPGVHRPSWCAPRNAGTHNRVPVYRAPSFPLCPFGRGRNVHHYLNGAHSALPRPSPVVHSHVPPSSFPRPRVIGALSPTVFLLRPFPPAKRRS
jgi:hypothetical protein